MFRMFYLKRVWHYSLNKADVPLYNRQTNKPNNQRTVYSKLFMILSYNFQLGLYFYG